MGEFITNDYQGQPFQFLGVAHIVILILLVLLNLFLLRAKKKDEIGRAHV